MKTDKKKKQRQQQKQQSQTLLHSVYNNICIALVWMRAKANDSMNEWV